MKNLVILGAGTAGTMMANKLATRLPEDWLITVVDRDDVHVYQPGLLFLPFGDYEEKDILKPRSLFFSSEIQLNLSGVTKVEADAKKVYLGDGSTLAYDVLIVATGTRLVPEQTEGLTGPGWHERVFDFYTLEGAMKLRHTLEDWKGGKLLVHFADMPIKCPVAPLEFLFLAEAFFANKGLRDAVDITYVTPLDAAFTKPKAAQAFGGVMEERNIALETNFAVEAVDGEAGVLKGYGDRALDFDLLVTVPLHAGSQAIMDSGLGDELGFVPTDKHTLQTLAHPEVFAIGDATNLPASKAGSVAHFQAEVLVENVMRFVEGKELEEAFDGHANCFIETGHGKAMLIDFNYDTEPLPGKFPLPGVGPFSLLQETAMNHWGKLGFKWAYWNLLLEGKELPIDHRMLMAGKRA
ncbi:MAG TPA: NAD(P)/FAD-dependent oxidoreductase [Polyangiaceae bacterium]|nr:NAD(P)/FAD-dependent oxidoreductase [Polyangiaceae bacterium]